MCIINHSKEFIFVHVPKSAGTSVTSLLSSMTTYKDLEIGGTGFGENIQNSYKNRFGIGKHTPAKKMKTIIDPRDWERFYKFAIVRNPYARIFSIYSFLRKWKSTENLVNEKMLRFESFSEFIRSGMIYEIDGPDQIFKPQTHWVMEANRTTHLLDFVGKVESLEADLKNILDHLNFERLSNAENLVPKLNVSVKDQDFELKNAYVDSEIVDLVRKRYMIDFKVFGYSEDPFFK